MSSLASLSSSYADIGMSLLEDEAEYLPSVNEVTASSRVLHASPVLIPSKASSAKPTALRERSEEPEKAVFSGATYSSDDGDFGETSLAELAANDDRPLENTVSRIRQQSLVLQERVDGARGSGPPPSLLDERKRKAVESPSKQVKGDSRHRDGDRSRKKKKKSKKKQKTCVTEEDQPGAAVCTEQARFEEQNEANISAEAARPVKEKSKKRKKLPKDVDIESPIFFQSLDGRPVHDSMLPATPKKRRKLSNEKAEESESCERERASQKKESSRRRKERKRRAKDQADEYIGATLEQHKPEAEDELKDVCSAEEVPPTMAAEVLLSPEEQLGLGPVTADDSTQNGQSLQTEKDDDLHMETDSKLQTGNDTDLRTENDYDPQAESDLQTKNESDLQTSNCAASELKLPPSHGEPAPRLVHEEETKLHVSPSMEVESITSPLPSPKMDFASLEPAPSFLPMFAEPRLSDASVAVEPTPGVPLDPAQFSESGETNSLSDDRWSTEDSGNDSDDERDVYSPVMRPFRADAASLDSSLTMRDGAMLPNAVEPSHTKPMLPSLRALASNDRFNPLLVGALLRSRQVSPDRGQRSEMNGIEGYASDNECSTSESDEGSDRSMHGSSASEDESRGRSTRQDDAQTAALAAGLKIAGAKRKSRRRSGLLSLAR